MISWTQNPSYSFINTNYVGACVVYGLTHLHIRFNLRWRLRS